MSSISLQRNATDIRENVKRVNIVFLILKNLKFYKYVVNFIYTDIHFNYFLLSTLDAIYLYIYDDCGRMCLHFKKKIIAGYSNLSNINTHVELQS